MVRMKFKAFGFVLICRWVGLNFHKSLKEQVPFAGNAGAPPEDVDEEDGVGQDADEARGHVDPFNPTILERKS